jgi:hypothetical protein
MKCIKTLKSEVLILKGQVPLKLKKLPAEQWQVISYRLIPRLTPVSFRCTVPFKGHYKKVRNVRIYGTRMLNASNKAS